MPRAVEVRAVLSVSPLRAEVYAPRDNSKKPHLPGNYVSNTVVYTATHDNPTTRGGFADLPEGRFERPLR
jgi:4-alpha-glucanotransferase